MPTYQVGLQDGRTLQIEADDQDAALAGAQHFIQNNPLNGSPSPQSNAGGAVPNAPQGTAATAGDIAKGAAKGIATGAEGLAGLPGDLESGVDWAMNKIMPLPAGANPHPGAIPQPPTTSQIDSVVGASKLPDAQTQWGQRAQNVAAFLPGAVAGPESLAKNLVQAGVAGAASEAAGEATKGTGLELPARVLAAMAVPSTLSKAEAALPTAEDLVSAGSQGRNDYRALNFSVRDGVMQNWAQNKINQYGSSPAAAIDPRGFDATQAPETHAVLQDIANHSGAAWAPDMDAWYNRHNGR